MTAPAARDVRAPFTLAIVGAGPRIITLLDRLAAQLATEAVETAEGLIATAPLAIHVFEPNEPGVGRVWDTAQSSVLLNNTTAQDTTVFADLASSSCSPPGPRPTLYEWAKQHVASRGAAHSGPAASEDVAEVPAWVADQARWLQPDSHPSRAFQGHYYRWAFARVVGELPPGTRVTAHRELVAELASERDGVRVRGADGTSLMADAVVLSQGFVADALTTEEQTLARLARATPGLVYLAPGPVTAERAARVPLDGPVLVRGMGANFFDLLGALHERLSGSLHVEDGRLLRFAALPSGIRLLVTSSTGLPKRSQPPAPGVPLRTAPVVSAELDRLLDGLGSGAVGSLSFRDELWPLLQSEFREVYEALASSADPEFAWEYMRRPSARHETDAWPEVVQRFISEEERSIADPEHSPWYAVRAAVLSRRRQLQRRIRRHEVGDSFAAEFADLLGRPSGRITSGPPAHRMSLLVQLVRAGLVEFLEPATAVAPGSAAFVALGGDGRAVEARALIEARESFGHIERSADPVIQGLVESGAARPFAASPAAPGLGAGLDVDGVNFGLRDGAGRVDERILVVGHAASSVQDGVYQGAVPGTCDPLFSESERAAQSVLALARRRIGSETA